MAEQQIARPKNPEDDWKVWLVLNPATWLMPILFAVLIIALAVHAMVFSLPQYSWGAAEEAAAPAPAAVEAPAPEAAPAQ
jgi:light-harvesting complex 1 alpha chain